MRQFTLWALSALNLRTEFDGDRFYTLYPPNGDRAAFNGASRIQFTFDTEVKRNSVERIEPGSPLLRWITRQLHKLGPAVQLTPLVQPVSVHEIASALLPHYSMNGGKVHMGACQIEQRPILRLTLAVKSGEGPPVVESHYSRSGEQLSAELVDDLQLQETSPTARWNSRFSAGDIQSWTASAVGSNGSDPPDVLHAAIIWCNYASGEIAFTARGQTAVAGFEDWARLLVKPDYQAPQFECKTTGRRSYDVELTSDNRFTVAGAVEQCPESGARLLSSGLSRCEYTGRRLNRALLQECPVTGARIDAAAMQTCAATGMKVNPACLRRGCSPAALNPAPVTHHDTRLAALLEKHPGLATYSGWRLCETITRYVFSAGRLKHLLLVVNPENNEIEHASLGNRVLGRWRTVDARELATLLEPEDGAAVE